MSGYVDHAWRHLPKALGGTDPLTIAAAVPSLPTALAKATYSGAVDNGGNLRLGFNTVNWNDDTVFSYDTATGSPLRTKYVMINKEGWWLARWEVHWNTDFTAGDFPFIDPYTLIAGSEAPLVSAGGGHYWDDTQNGIYGTQYNGDVATGHRSLYSFMCFCYEDSVWGGGGNPVGLGIAIRSSVARTKVWGGNMTLTWVGDPLVTQTLA